jgi:hypothetical protein
MTQTAAETLVGVLEHIGVKQIFALIGDPAQSAGRGRAKVLDRMDWRSP